MVAAEREREAGRRRRERSVTGEELGAPRAGARRTDELSACKSSSDRGTGICVVELWSVGMRVRPLKDNGKTASSGVLAALPLAVRVNRASLRTSGSR